MENDLRRWMRLVEADMREAEFILDLFQLPTEKVDFYDDPTRGVGDENVFKC